MNAATAGMSAAASSPWPAVRRVLLSAWQAQHSRRWLWLLLALAVLLPGLGIWFRTDPQTRLWPLLLGLASLPLAFVLVAGWLLLVFNVLMQNHPQLARQVPGQVAALRRALLAGLGLVVALCGLAAVLLDGPALAAVSACAIICTALAAAQRWPQLWLLLLLPLWTSGIWVTSLAGVQQELQLLWQALAWPCTAAALLLSALALSRVVMNGGAAHAKAHARLVTMNAAMRGQVLAQGPRQVHPWLGSLAARGGGTWYDAHLRRLLARRDSPALARLAMGMGPQAHWTGSLAANTAGVVMAVLFTVVTMLFPSWQMGAAIRSGMALGLSVAAIAMMGQLPAAIWASRREQALLRLLPQAPQGAALNRWLALRLSGLHLAVIALQMATVAVLAAVSDIDQQWPHTSRLGMATVFMGCLLIPLLWRDWSRLRAASGMASLQQLLAMALCSGASASWVLVLQWPLWALYASVAALLALLLLWRWRAVGRLPVAWPAGRLST